VRFVFSLGTVYGMGNCGNANLGGFRFRGVSVRLDVTIMNFYHIMCCFGFSSEFLSEIWTFKQA
jgi:hypothetical protein